MMAGKNEMYLADVSDVMCHLKAIIRAVWELRPCDTCLSMLLMPYLGPANHLREATGLPGTDLQMSVQPIFCTVTNEQASKH